MRLKYVKKVRSKRRTQQDGYSYPKHSVQSVVLLLFFSLGGSFQPAARRSQRFGLLRQSLPNAAEIQSADFMTSLDLAGPVCDSLRSLQRDDEQMPDTNRKDLRAALAALLSHSDGARGFFVRWLADSYLEDQEHVYDEVLPEELVAALHGAPEDIVSPLCVMNLIMPTAMASQYERKWDKDAAAASAATATRAAHIIEEMKEGQVLTSVTRKMHAALASITGEALVELDVSEIQRWADFMQKWEYDVEQKDAIRNVLRDVLDIN